MRLEDFVVVVAVVVVVPIVAEVDDDDDSLVDAVVVVSLVDAEEDASGADDVGGGFGGGLFHSPCRAPLSCLLSPPQPPLSLSPCCCFFLHTPLALVLLLPKRASLGKLMGALCW